MKRLNFLRWVAIVPAFALATLNPSTARADAVTDWNAIMQETLSTPPTNPVFQTRWGAIVQLAVFEAVNSIERHYEPYLGISDAPAWASPDAAAIAAAHRTLVTLRPGSAAALDAARTASLAAIPDGLAKDAGILVGEYAAYLMILLRMDDGSDANVPYTPGNKPGDWQPTPPANAAAAFTQWGQITPFGLKKGSQFRLPAPPALQTEKYARDYNEVKLLGHVDSPFRPQHRTDVARFYAAATPTQVWNAAARQASAAQGLSLSQNARVFALVNMAMADAAIAAFDSKYHYNLWRPVTAIRNGDLDGNDLTTKDPDWLPLIATPAFPSYPSAHATVSNSARAVLTRAFGKNGHAVKLTHAAVPNVELNYTAWEQITADIDDARIYGGIHFRFDQEAGNHQGRHVGKYTYRNYLRCENDEPEENEDE